MHGTPAAPIRVAGASLGVRPLRPDECGSVVRYFLDASDADLERMGVERARLPAAADWTRSLQAAVAAPATKATSFYSAWLVDGTAIGYAALKYIRRGDSADIHLHMWSPAHRGKGFGPALFCLSALDAYDRFALRTLVCEPRAANPMPNRLLAKVGFPLVRSYVGASSELSTVATLNRYDIERGIAEAYLATVASRP